MLNYFLSISNYTLIHYSISTAFKIFFLNTNTKLLVAFNKDISGGPRPIRGAAPLRPNSSPFWPSRLRPTSLSSILDDPSVSRVMREAGFPSTLTKSNVEQSLSPELSSSQTNNTSTATNYNSSNAIITTNSSFKPIYYQTLQVANVSNPFELGFSKPLSQVARSEAVWSVTDAWVRRKERSSVVLVGECLGSCEGVLRAVKERVERGDHNVPMELRYVQFLNCPLLENLSREEIDVKVGEIRCLLKGCAGRAGVVLYLGDPKWVAEYWAYYNTDSEQQKRHNYYCYCPVEHLIMGLRRLVFENVGNGRIWLMGVSTFNSFMKCKTGNPSLETLLDLHALTIPSATLDLTLNLDSSKSNASTNTDCSFPSWLQKCKEESSELSTHRQDESVQMKELCEKWDLIGSSKSQKTSKFPDRTINFVSCSPSSSPSISSHDDNCKQIISAWPTTVFEPKWAFKEHQFLTPNNQTCLFLNTPKPEIISDPNSMPNSASSSETTEPIIIVDRFKENNPENLEALCCALESKVPWHRDIIPEIAMTILRCRSGECNQGSRVKQETWLSFLGPDDDGKHKIARELARLVFGTQSSSFKSVGLSSFSSSTQADSTEDCHLKSNKR